ncbi:MAG: DUF2225 domain-containing protein [Eubacterium sp.]|nr:DUF2225 domain-containing protein [Eubacterium sp.]
MANLFAGLENLGLNGLDSNDVFKEEKKQEVAKEEKHELTEEEKEAREEDFIFDKSYTCPVCDHEFTSKMVRTGKVRLIGADDDLRPVYQDVDSLKYDAVLCPKCGYAALNRYFNFVMSAQAKAIKENISANFTYHQEEGRIYNYDDAILRHKMALACTVVKRGKSSEKAYTCLKLGWLCRGKRELLMKGDDSLKEEIASLAEEEKECLQQAFAGFKDAFSKEDFPMCGMDQHTMMYLLAELAYRTGNESDAKFYVSKVLTARDANSRIKNKALDLKEKLQGNA